jgi:hypothetical protein
LRSGLIGMEMNASVRVNDAVERVLRACNCTRGYAEALLGVSFMRKRLPNSCDS